MTGSKHSHLYDLYKVLMAETLLGINHFITSRDTASPVSPFCSSCGANFTDYQTLVRHLQTNSCGDEANEPDEGIMSYSVELCLNIMADLDEEQSQIDEDWDPLDDLDDQGLAPFSETGDDHGLHSSLATASPFPMAGEGSARQQFALTIGPLSTTSLHRQPHPNPGLHQPGGMNLLQQMENDQLMTLRKESNNIFYPFASEEEWELASWMTTASLTQQQIDRFCCLRYASLLPVSIYL